MHSDSNRVFIHQELTAQGFAGNKKPEISTLRTVMALSVMALAAFLVYILADWTQLRNAMQEFRGHPWLLLALVAAYTGAFLLRAIAWRALIVNRIGLYWLFVSMQAGLLVNHLVPVKLGEFVRPLLATRYGVPIAEAATTTAIARVLDFAAHCLSSLALSARSSRFPA